LGLGFPLASLGSIPNLLPFVINVTFAIVVPVPAFFANIKN